MENAQKKFIVRKILLALLPTIVFWQNYAWMTLNAFLGIAFLVIWALMVWNVWQFTEKNHIMERFFMLTEIAFFLLPLSAIVFSFVLGSQAVSSTTNEFEQAGAAIGTAIGGTFVVILAFIIGIIGGIIMHLVTSKYDKKANESKEKQPENLPAKHGVILSLVAVIVLAIIMGSISSANQTKQEVKEKEELSQSLQQAGSKETNEKTTETAEKKPEIKKVELEVVKKGFHEADFMAGEYEDQITMDLKFINKTEKAIKGVQGIISFYDIFDDEILSTNISYDEGIDANGEKVWNAGIGYNQFMDEHEKLKNTTMENLKYKWDVKTIIYKDNTKETF